MNIKYTSLKSVLYDLSTIMGENMWNEAYMYEWAAKALRKIAPEVLLVDKICATSITEHTAVLPSDLRFVTMIVWKASNVTDSTVEDELQRLMNLENTIDNPALNHMAYPNSIVLTAQNLLPLFAGYLPLRRSSSPFMTTFHCDDEFYTCPDCSYEYVINPDLTITSTLRQGDIIVAYKAYPKDGDGGLLMPDDEDLKEAILHYCMYRYYLTRTVVHEEASYQERDWHLNRFATLSAKAKGNLNLPDLDTLENMSRNYTRLKKREHMYDNLFGNLGYKENTLP